MLLKGIIQLAGLKKWAAHLLEFGDSVFLQTQFAGSNGLTTAGEPEWIPKKTTNSVRWVFKKNVNMKYQLIFSYEVMNWDYLAS